jgi:hypothetical protein
MVDDINPTTQFHPYRAPDATPQTGEPLNSGRGGLSAKLGGLGNLDLSGGLTRVRGFAGGNGGLVLGGLAVLAIGFGLWRRRSTRVVATQTW